MTLFDYLYLRFDRAARAAGPWILGIAASYFVAHVVVYVLKISGNI